MRLSGGRWYIRLLPGSRHAGESWDMEAATTALDRAG
jgi:hypothetical protein